MISSTVQSALSRVTGTDTLIAVAGNFTLEALRLLHSRNALVLQLYDSGLTDERYIEINQKK